MPALPSVSRKTYFYLGLFLFLLISFHYLGWLNKVKIFFRAWFTPIFTRGQSLNVKAGERYEFFGNSEDFLKEYEQCMAQNADAAVNNAKLKILGEENNQLREQLKYQNQQKIAQVSAEVVGSIAEPNEKALIINRGYEQGIKKEQPVIVGAGALIGKIKRVEKDTAFIRLVNDNQSKVAATVLNRERSLGVVEGGYDISLSMKFIPRNENVLTGDMIVTSGLENNIPKGLLIGKVVAVESEAFKPFQQAVVDPAVNLSKITLVSVLLTN